MKKITAILVALLILIGNFSCVMASAEEVDLSLISSVTIEAQNNQYYEYTNGRYTTYYPNGYDNPEEEFYYYYIPEYEIIVNYNDGSFEKFTDSWEFTEKFGYEYLQYDDGGQYEEPWNVGENTFNFTIFGFQVPLKVTVLERPFESFVAVPEYTSVYKNTKGYETTYWDDELQEVLPFWHYELPYCQFILYYKDGTSETVDWYQISEKFGDAVYPSMYDPQWNTPFTEGTYPIEVEIMGYRSSFDFTVEEFNPKNVEIVAKNNVYKE